MELYVAIPKAITDIYWNRLPNKSEALGVFYVTPEITKGLLGKTTITGFKEAITGKKIIDRFYYGTEYGIESKDVDCMIEKTAQVGDLVWEVIDKSTADRLVPPEELQKLMSLSPEEIQEQLQNIRTKARIIGQEQRNLETERRFDNPNMNPNEIYLAVPRAITNIHWNGLYSKSEALGIFCIKPEVKKGLLGKTTITGFKEAITGKKIIDRFYYETEYGTEPKDIDCMIEKTAQVGDISWDVVNKSTADRLLPPEELQKLMSLPPEEIQKQLQSIRTQAIKIGQNAKHVR